MCMFVYIHICTFIYTCVCPLMMAVSGEWDGAANRNPAGPLALWRH